MKDDLLNILVGKAFLFLTTTDIETDTFLSELTPLAGKQVIKIAIGNHTYHIGKFGYYLAIHVQCNSMGMINPGASITTTIEAIGQWNPVGVVIVGIAFGINKKKQHIGDVLVSHSIIDYESAKLSLGKKEYRNHNVISGNILYDRFKNMRSWEFLLPRNQRAQPIFGDILSGEKLVDDESVIKELKSIFTTAIGGEMESYGVFTACKNAGISEWIMVKGICDWADGSKSVKKDYRQRIAAQSAISLCKAVFSEKVFEDICDSNIKSYNDVINANRPDLGNVPVLPIVFLLDTSGSMAGSKIAALSSALVKFRNSLSLDINSRYSVEVSIITFSTDVKIVQNFTSIYKMKIPDFDANGVTNMGEAVKVAIYTIEEYKKNLAKSDIRYYKPFLILITDGMATDDITLSVNMVNKKLNSLNFWAFAIDGADYEQLLTFTKNVIKVYDDAFDDIFKWVSSSVSTIINSGDKDDLRQLPLLKSMSIDAEW